VKHSTANIFVCPTRVFILKEDGIIPEQPFPIDHWIEEDEDGIICSCCGQKREDSE